ncbi:hypothetical protein HYT53_04665 [Candidatus Woesearchaeota archaeon]|nr:hypothetical protein [Candidatus Woesearchaeota archaeon]
MHVKDIVTAVKEYREGINIAKIVERVLDYRYGFSTIKPSKDDEIIYYSKHEILNTKPKKIGYMDYALISPAFIHDGLKTIEGLVS